MANLSLHPPGLPPVLHHPIIGQIQGRYNKGVVQYLGIKYASLQDRFAEPEIIQYPEHQQIDATRHGPPVVTPAGAADMEMSFVQEHLPKPDLPPMSDLDGLNLNITVPQDGGNNLPVVVYVHGGGFAFGSSTYPHYDQSKVVELSAIMDQRIVAVNFNYRLGIPGFLISKELQEAGFKANRGLRDQRAALLWIKKYISGFGGDPQRITVVGQSAGAASVNFQMHLEEPLFKQAILLGGSFLMMKPATEDDAEYVCKAILNRMGLGDLTSEEQIKALLTLPQEKLVAEISPELVSLGPIVDRDFIPAAARFDNISDDTKLPLPGKKWCHRLFIIESQFDGSIFGLVNLNAREKGIARSFVASVRKSLGPEAACKLLWFYDISEDTPDSKALLSIIQFVTDISFYAPAVKLAGSWPGPSYLGHFNERNPFEGLYKGRASHLLDTAYMWGNYNQKYTKQNWIVARAMAENLVSFVNGTDNLPVFNGSSGDVDGKKLVTVYGPSEENVSSKVEQLGTEATCRNHRIFGLANEIGGLDVLLDAMVAFLKN